MKTTQLLACLLAVVLCGIARAEVGRDRYESPDKKWLVQVDWRSEAPDLNVFVKQGDKILLRYHPGPKDRIRIYWHPNSKLFLMEHVTIQKEYRLYMIDVRQQHLEMIPIMVEEGVHPATIVSGTIEWGAVGSNGFVSKLTIEDQSVRRREMRFQDWHFLEAVSKAEERRSE